MSTVTSDVYFDPYDREIYARPYEVYQRLRDEAPLYYNEGYDFYAVSRFADVERVLVDRATFISGKGGVLGTMNVPMPPGLFIYEDPPHHTMHRALVSRVFTPKRVASIELQIRSFCARTVDALACADHFDFVWDFAAEIPMRVIGMLVGIPEEDQATIRDRFFETMHAADPSNHSLQDLAATAEGMFGEYVDWRAEHPSDDLMTQLLNIEFEDESGGSRKLRRDEVLVYLELLASAGSDTTARLIGWTGKLLGDHPDQRRELANDPSLIPEAIEETLRFEPPPYHVCRVLSEDVVIHGETVPAGAVLVVLPGAANRDGRRFSDPETFDIHRSISRTFAFGFGAHLCLGANLARIEGRIALEEILKRIPNWTVDSDRAELTPGTSTRGWESLPVVAG